MKHDRWALIAWLAALFVAMMPAMAEARATPHIDATLITETREPAAGPRSSSLAFRMNPERGWHGYWINPGDSGLPATVDWEAPAGVRFTKLQHPAPKLLSILGIASYVHEGPFSLVASVTIPEGLPKGTPLPIKAKLSWLACSDSLCVPESASLTTTLLVGAGTPEADGADQVARPSPRCPRRFRVRLMRRSTDSGSLIFLGLPGSSRPPRACTRRAMAGSRQVRLRQLRGPIVDCGSAWRRPTRVYRALSAASSQTGAGPIRSRQNRPRPAPRRLKSCRGKNRNHSLRSHPPLPPRLLSRQPLRMSQGPPPQAIQRLRGCCLPRSSPRSSGGFCST